MKTNVANKDVTHEGGRASISNAHESLRRTVSACLLFEDTFYEDGVSIADRLSNLVKASDPSFVADLAKEVRDRGIRHAPLLLCRELAREGNLHPDTLTHCIQRADEIAEFLALYWKDGKTPLSKASQKGLAQAFFKFNEYQFAKYSRDGAVKLRDALRVTHPKPDTDERSALFAKIAKNTLETPDTWETALSRGENKTETFTRLLREKKLGYTALLRNLRNMEGVEDTLIAESLNRPNREFPHAFLAADKFTNGKYRSLLNNALLRSLVERPKLNGTTLVLVDVSGSMDENLSGKSKMTRREAASSLAILLQGVCEKCEILTFSDHVVKVEGQGLDLASAIDSSQFHSGTQMGQAVKNLRNVPCDRIIVITDEQSQDTVPAPHAKGYIMNVASYQNGVGYGQWTHIHGFSQHLVDYLLENP